MIEKQVLVNLYNKEKLSMKEISKKLNCSIHKVSYWMNNHKISRRTISEGVYIQHNPRRGSISF